MKCKNIWKLYLKVSIFYHKQNQPEKENKKQVRLSCVIIHSTTMYLGISCFPGAQLTRLSGSLRILLMI